MANSFRTLLVCPDEPERQLMLALLSSLRFPTDVEASSEFGDFLGRSWDCILVDTRIYRTRVDIRAVSIQPRVGSQKALLLHYGADLDAPVVIASIGNMRGSISTAQVDKRARDWVKGLATKIESYFFGQRVIELCDAIRPPFSADVSRPLCRIARTTSLLRLAVHFAGAIGENPDAQDAARLVLGIPESESVLPFTIRVLEGDDVRRPRSMNLPHVAVRWWSPQADRECESFAEALNAELDGAVAFSAMRGDRVTVWLATRVDQLVSLPFVYRAGIRQFAVFALSDASHRRRTVLRYAAMQVVLQGAHGPCSAGWVWLRDALSVWYAVRYEDEDAAGILTNTRRPLDDLHGNRAAGMHFVSFLEESYGTAFVRALVGCDGSDPWATIAGLANTSKASLVVGFFSWAARQGILAEVGRAVSAVIEIDHCSARLLRAPAGSARLKLRLESRSQSNMALSFLEDGHSIATFLALERQSVFWLPRKCNAALLVNTGTRSREGSSPNDDSARVEVFWDVAERMGQNQP